MVDSECDSDDDDEPASVNHLSGRQLVAEAQCNLRRIDGSLVRIGTTENDSVEEYSNESEEESVLVIPEKRKRIRGKISAKTSKKVKPNRRWKEQDIKKDESLEATSNIPRLIEKDWSPVDLFEFFDDDVVDQIVEFSNNYAKTTGHHSFQMNVDKLRLFIGLLLASGYVPLPRRRLYWEHQPDVHNEASLTAMSRNSFEEMLCFLHLSDNHNLEQNDKFAKVRPLLRHLNERWLLYAPPDSNLSIDESMIPYYGRYGAKQHIHGKPIRFGYKMWSLATAAGYLLQCEPYQGAATGYTTPDLGLGGSVVADLISELPTDRKYHTSMLKELEPLELFGKTGLKVHHWKM